MYISCTDSINNSNNKSILIKYDSLEIYNPFNVKLEKKQKANPFTIIAYINVSCASCLEEISKWNDFYSKINKNKTDIIMICYSKDNFEYFRYLCETNKIENTNNIFYLDNYKVFEENNSILRLRHTDQTVLLDSNNNILLGGNPFHSAEVKANYFSILKNTSK
jgi:hypothetical protein